MTLVYEVKCDTCKLKANLKYNGEHWLIPKDWVCLYDDHLAEKTGEHLCQACRPKIKKKPQEAAK